MSGLCSCCFWVWCYEATVTCRLWFTLIFRLSFRRCSVYAHWWQLQPSVGWNWSLCGFCTGRWNILSFIGVFLYHRWRRPNPPPNTRPPGLLFSRWVKFPGGVCFWRCIIMCSASFMPNFMVYLVKDIMIHAHPLTNHHTYVTICSQRPSKRQCTAPPVHSTPLPGPSHCGMDRCSLCFGCDTALKDLFVLSCRTIWVWNMNMKSTLSFFHHLWCQWDALLLYFGEQFTSR